MPSQHKNPHGIFWRPGDPTLKPWIENEASERGVTLREYLDEVLAVHRARAEMNGRWVYHKDGDPLNNDPGNLEIRGSEQ
jgi:hypothetical protein